MNEYENRRLILSNFYRAIAGTTQALVDRAKDSDEFCTCDHRESQHGEGCRKCDCERFRDTGALETTY